MSDGADFWTDRTDVLLTSFWGWSPETWGAIGFTKDRGRGRRNNIVRDLSDPFICVCYVTSNKTPHDPTLKGMIAGFYLVGHEMGDRDEFTHPRHHEQNPDKWRYSLKAVRAFTYLPEYRLSIRDFDPEVLRRARSVAGMGEVITDREKIKILRDLTPWVETDVYSAGHPPDGGSPPRPARGKVRAGPANGSDYFVSGGAINVPRRLYILRLVGNIDHYLGRPAGGRAIFKVGLSASPELRRQSFEKAMPWGAFKWKIDRASDDQGSTMSFDAAVEGEDKMKMYLESCAEWRGGEFYLATEEQIDVAWLIGQKAAKSFGKKGPTK